jgi:cytochrome c-type biogenesis protein
MSGGSGGASVAIERPIAAVWWRDLVGRARRWLAPRWKVLTHAIVFVLGFTLVFAIIGGLLGSARDLLLTENPIFHTSNRRILQYIMGVLLVVFGLHMIGLINIPWLNYERRLGDKIRPGANLTYARSFLIGLGFGLGWTPCIGPTLALIFGLAMNGEQGQAILPFLAYSIGLGLPFMLTALAMGSISKGLKRLTRYSYTLKVGKWTAIDRVNVVSLISGGLLIVMGMLIFSNLLEVLAPALPGIGNL